MKWQPWEDFRADAEPLPITDPPCRDCQYFKPHRSHSPTGVFIGVVICTNIGEQCNDFSCYKAKS